MFQKHSCMHACFKSCIDITYMGVQYCMQYCFHAYIFIYRYTYTVRISLDDHDQVLGPYRTLLTFPPTRRAEGMVPHQSSALGRPCSRCPWRQSSKPSRIFVLESILDYMSVIVFLTCNCMFGGIITYKHITCQLKLYIYLGSFWN